MLILRIVECENTPQSRHESSHHLLSQMLSQYTKLSYSQLEKDENGKPYINGTAFSISHSRDVVCVALCVGEQSVDDAQIVDAKATPTSIGVDIESVFDKSVEQCKKIAEQKYFENENNLLNKCERDEEYVKLFCLMWTQKESYSKFTGIGLKDALSYDTTLESDTLKVYSECLTINDRTYALSICYNSIEE